MAEPTDYALHLKHVDDYETVIASFVYSLPGAHHDRLLDQNEELGDTACEANICSADHAVRYRGQWILRQRG